jgi:hypothetical protein
MGASIDFFCLTLVGWLPRVGLTFSFVSVGSGVFAGARQEELVEVSGG